MPIVLLVVFEVLFHFYYWYAAFGAIIFTISITFMTYLAKIKL
jgi:hypothetical protein